MRTFNEYTTQCLNIIHADGLDPKDFPLWDIYEVFVAGYEPDDCVAALAPYVQFDELEVMYERD